MAYVPFAFDFFRKMTSYAAAKKSVVVTNQKQLEKALKNGATNIVIKTNKNVKITIPATKKAQRLLFPYRQRMQRLPTRQVLSLS